MTVTGMATGAALGAALGLIYSPGTGEENRKHLVGWANARIDDVSANLHNQLERASTWADHRRTEVRDKAQYAASGVQEQVARVVPGAAPAPETGGTEC